MKEKELKVGDKCPQCGQIAELRKCSVCGVEEVEIDCGHFAQPQFISAGHHNGLDMNEDFCENCDRDD